MAFYTHNKNWEKSLNFNYLLVFMNQWRSLCSSTYFLFVKFSRKNNKNKCDKKIRSKLKSHFIIGEKRAKFVMKEGRKSKFFIFIIAMELQLPNKSQKVEEPTRNIIKKWSHWKSHYREIIGQFSILFYLFFFTLL